jgi:hypothetical protein
MIHGKNHRPIRAHDSGSHGSKGPLPVPNRLTRGLGTWGSDKETHGGLPTQEGSFWAHLAVGRPGWSAEWAQEPPTFPLDRKLPHTFLMAVLGA